MKASPDAFDVDLFVDNVKENITVLINPGNTEYLKVASGNRNVKENATGISTLVINADVSLMANTAYSIFCI